MGTTESKKKFIEAWRRHINDLIILHPPKEEHYQELVELQIKLQKLVTEIAETKKLK
jgi:hypothetical protein